MGQEDRRKAGKKKWGCAAQGIDGGSEGDDRLAGYARTATKPKFRDVGNGKFGLDGARVHGYYGVGADR